MRPLNVHGLQIKSYWDEKKVSASFQRAVSHRNSRLCLRRLIASLIDCHATEPPLRQAPQEGVRWVHQPRLVRHRIVARGLSGAHADGCVLELRPRDGDQGQEVCSR